MKEQAYVGFFISTRHFDAGENAGAVISWGRGLNSLGGMSGMAALWGTPGGVGTEQSWVSRTAANGLGKTDILGFKQFGAGHRRAS